MSWESLSKDIQDEIFAYQYRSHFRLSVEQFEREPWEALAQARLIWSLEAQRERDQPDNSRQTIEDDW